LNKAVMLEEIDRPDDARETYQEIVNAFNEGESRSITSAVAWASTRVDRLS
jgi:hypothetical protein